MLNILFITISNIENIYEKGIYTDLVRELARRGVNMHVVVPREKRNHLPTELTITQNIKLLKVKTGNITKTKNFIEKGISTLNIGNQFLKAVKRYFEGVRFDLIMYTAPPTTVEKVVKLLKKEHRSKTYLLLKDIFPQNAVDLQVFKEGSLIWKYFRYKEKKLYEVSDVIGCMSEGNVHYLLNHNPYIDKNQVEVFPNSIEPAEKVTRTNLNNELRRKFNITNEMTLFVYGGNLGKPQGVDFLLEVADHFYKVNNGYLLIVGSGTEYEKVRNHLFTFGHKNASLLKNLPKNEYDQLLEIADVGLIFLDKRFTIPNIPSRLTAYMEYSLPILAATDKNTDLKDILIESKSGLWSESGDLNSFINNAINLSMDKDLRNQMGMNGREYLEEHYDIRKTVNTIIKHL